MERALLCWVTGLMATGFFGFFAVWTYGDRDGELSHTALFWLSVAGTAVGLVLLLMAVIATGVSMGLADNRRRGD